MGLARHSTKLKKYQNTEQAEVKIASEKLEASYAGMIGKTIEPVIRPLGFDWKIGISLVTSFAAREVFVGTMSTIYSVGDADNTLLSKKNSCRQSGLILASHFSHQQWRYR